jgi:hypothetical protein
MRHGFVEAEIRRRIPARGGHDIPAYSPIAQMVQGRDAAGKVERVALQDRAREGQAQVFGRTDECGRQDGRVIGRKVDAFLEIDIPAAVMPLVDTHHIGQEQRIETSSFQDASQVDPSR